MQKPLTPLFLKPRQPLKTGKNLKLDGLFFIPLHRPISSIQRPALYIMGPSLMKAHGRNITGWKKSKLLAKTVM